MIKEQKNNSKNFELKGKLIVLKEQKENIMSKDKNNFSLKEFVIEIKKDLLETINSTKVDLKEKINNTNDTIKDFKSDMIKVTGVLFVLGGVGLNYMDNKFIKQDKKLDELKQLIISQKKTS